MFRISAKYTQVNMGNCIGVCHYTHTQAGAQACCGRWPLGAQYRQKYRQGTFLAKLGLPSHTCGSNGGSRSPLGVRGRLKIFDFFLTHLWCRI